MISQLTKRICVVVCVFLSTQTLVCGGGKYARFHDCTVGKFKKEQLKKKSIRYYVLHDATKNKNNITSTREHSLGSDDPFIELVRMHLIYAALHGGGYEIYEIYNR